MARWDVGCWVAAAISRLFRSRASSILWRIVMATKANTWSHSLALRSMIGTKLSGVRGSSPPLVGWSSHLPGTTEIPDTQMGCARHHLAPVCHSWTIRVSYRIGMHWTPHGRNYLGLGKNPSVRALSPTTPQDCVLTNKFTLFSSLQKAVLSIYAVWLAFHHTRPAALFHSLD